MYLYLDTTTTSTTTTERPRNPKPPKFTPSPTRPPSCITNENDFRFRCDCFDSSDECPRTSCTYNLGGNRGCEELRAGTVPGPVQCRLNARPDQCTSPADCMDSANQDSGCTPMSSMGSDFGCCKSMS